MEDRALLCFFTETKRQHLPLQIEFQRVRLQKGNRVNVFLYKYEERQRIPLQIDKVSTCLSTDR